MVQKVMSYHIEQAEALRHAIQKLSTGHHHYRTRTIDGAGYRCELGDAKGLRNIKNQNLRNKDPFFPPLLLVGSQEIGPESA